MDGGEHGGGYLVLVAGGVDRDETARFGMRQLKKTFAQTIDVQFSYFSLQRHPLSRNYKLPLNVWLLQVRLSCVILIVSR